jgi:hypothetical protein
MPEPLHKIITSLKNTNRIKNNAELYKNLSEINKYCLSEQSKAYYLGLFFKHKCPIDTIDPKIKSNVLENIRTYDLLLFFNDGKKYADLSSTLLILFFGLIGLLFLLMGLNGISTNKTLPSFSHTRLSTTTDTALGKIFFGAAILIGVLWSLSYFIRRNGLEKELLRSKSQTV